MAIKMKAPAAIRMPNTDARMVPFGIASRLLVTAAYRVCSWVGRMGEFDGAAVGIIGCGVGSGGFVGEFVSSM